MIITASPHIRHYKTFTAVDLLTNDLVNIGNTLAWAFPDSRLTKGLRGETLLDLDGKGRLCDIMVDFSLGQVFVYPQGEVFDANNPF